MGTRGLLKEKLPDDQELNQGGEPARKGKDMIIATIGNVKIKFNSIEDAAAAFAAIQKGEHVDTEYQPFPMPDTYHPGGPLRLEIAIVDAEVVPRTEKQKEDA